MGLRADEPLKITSVIESPRKCFAELSPSTQRTASITLDFPQPLGPIIADKALSNGILVGSTNDLNPASFICFNLMLPVQVRIKRKKQLTLAIEQLFVTIFILLTQLITCFIVLGSSKSTI
jgi:hypothetical protein